MSSLSNFTIRKPIVDGFVEKAVVKEHQRTSKKTGKTSNVKQYEDKRRKQQERQGEQQTQQHPAAKIDKELQHIAYMEKNYGHLIDRNKVADRKKMLKDKKREIEDKLDELDSATTPKSDLHEHLAKARSMRGKKKKKTQGVNENEDKSGRNKSRYKNRISKVDRRRIEEGIHPRTGARLSEEEKKELLRKY